MSNLTLSQTKNYWDQYVYDNDKVPYYTNISTEIERVLKYDMTLLLSKKIEFDLGVLTKAITFNHDEWFHADTIYTYDTSVEPNQQTGIFANFPEWKVTRDENMYKLGTYGQTRLRPCSWLTLTAGIRYDYMRFIIKGALDPRLAVSIDLGRRTSINLAAGQQSQSPIYVTLTANDDNKDLGYKKTQHVVLGLEKLFREDMRGTFEVFYKDYRGVPVPLAWTTADPFDRANGRFVDQGHGCKGNGVLLAEKND